MFIEIKENQCFLKAFFLLLAKNAQANRKRRMQLSDKKVAF